MRVTTIQGRELDLSPQSMLRGELLRDLDLSGVDLSGSDLRDCAFNGSNLSGARLCNCDLRGAIFFETDLSGADFSGSQLDDCYWRDAVVSSETVWPSDGVRVEILRSPDTERWMGQARDVGPDLYEGRLCSIKWSPRGHVLTRTDPSVHFVPEEIRDLVGPVNEKIARLLFLHLALNIWEGVSSLGLNEPASLYGLSVFPDDGYQLDPGAEDAIRYTHVCSLLATLNLRISEIVDKDRIRVTFGPIRPMSEHIASDLFILFRLLYESARGVGVGDSFTSRDFLEFDPISDAEIEVLGTCRADIQLSTDWIDGQAVANTSRTSTRSPRTPEETLMIGIIDYCLFASRSLIELIDGVADSGKTIIKSINSLRNYGFGFEHLVFRLLGVEQISHAEGGVLTAVLLPPMDIRRVLLDTEWMDEEELDELGVLLSESHSPELSFGAFEDLIKVI